MKILALTLASMLLTAAVAVPAARACGSYSGAALAAVAPAERAVGLWPAIERVDGHARLELHYPRFQQSGAYLYMDWFTVVEDARFRRLQRLLAGEAGRALTVSVEQVGADRWRITGWSVWPARDA